VSGLIVCGTVGENCSLRKDEKIAVMEAGKAVARRRLPVISGIAEFTSAFAIDMAREAARIGLDGVMVMPALVYSSKPHETAAHFRSVARRRYAAGHGLQQPADLQERRHAEILASLRLRTIVCFNVGDTPASPTFTIWSATASCCSQVSTTSWWRASWSGAVGWSRG
jgi:4-hydroxy-tetrahydrodipicolinate synthase